LFDVVIALPETVVLALTILSAAVVDGVLPDVVAVPIARSVGLRVELAPVIRPRVVTVTFGYVPAVTPVNERLLSETVLRAILPLAPPVTEPFSSSVVQIAPAAMPIESEPVPPTLASVPAPRALPLFVK
jgi:hypothetical protein